MRPSLLPGTTTIRPARACGDPVDPRGAQKAPQSARRTRRWRGVTRFRIRPSYGACAHQAVLMSVGCVCRDFITRAALYGVNELNC